MDLHGIIRQSEGGLSARNGLAALARWLTRAAVLERERERERERDKEREKERERERVS